jgi:hypothetical protein
MATGSASWYVLWEQNGEGGNAPYAVRNEVHRCAFCMLTEELSGIHWTKQQTNSFSVCLVSNRNRK